MILLIYLGEIECKKISLQTVCDCTYLNESTAAILSSSPHISISLNHLFSTIYYQELFFLIEKFINLDSYTITIQRKNRNEYYGSATAERKVLKSQILNIFDKALDDMFYQPLLKDEQASAELCRQLLEMINSEFGITDTEILCKKISHSLEKIKELNNTEEFLLLYTPRQIISKRQMLSRYYGIIAET